MKKNIIQIGVLIMLFVFFVACNPSESNSKKELSDDQSNTFTITLVANFDGGEDKPISVTKNTDITLPAIGTVWNRKGYFFKGWSASETSDEISYEDKAVFTALFDQKLYAVWKKIVNISYDANGGKGKIEDQTFLYGDTIKIADGNDFKNGDYVFACWNTKADGSGSNIEIGTEYSDDISMTLYAQWIKVNSSLTMDVAEYDYQYYSYVSDCSEYAVEINIPEYYKGYKVTKIGKEAFQNCSKLTRIDLPNNLVSIGWSAFYNCTNLSDINLPESLTSIGLQAFWGCTSLKVVDIPNGVTELGNSVFGNCTNLTTVTIPDSVEILGSSIFKNCSNLSKVSLNNNIKSITSGMFYNCSNLVSINIPDSVTSIDMYAFNGCTKLQNINIPYGVTSIGNYAFSECSSLEEITIPDSVTEVGSAVFYGCSGLKRVTLSKKIEDMPCEEKGGVGFFKGCTSLTDIVLPDELKTISNYMFRGCSNLKSVAVGDKVSSIGAYSFYECDKLETINIPSTVTSIKVNAFTSENISITYQSTINDWNKIQLESGWKSSSTYSINCKDGVLVL